MLPVIIPSARSQGRLLVCIALLLAIAGVTRAEEIRLINGVAVRGEIRAQTDAGIEIQTDAGQRSFPWYALSPGTRYRLQPSYRANFSAILAGKPPGERSQTPSQSAATQTLPAPATAMLTLDDVSKASQIDLTRIDGIKPSKPDEAVSWALRYGPDSKNVVLFVFDVPESGKMPQGAWAFDATGGGVTRLDMSRVQHENNPSIRFGPLSREADFPGAKVTMSVLTFFLENDPATMLVSADVKVDGAAGLARFRLTGPPPGVAAGRKRVTAKDFLTVPALALVSEMSGTKPRLAGAVRMGRLKIWPMDGMDRQIAVTIKEGNRTVLSRTLPLDAADGEDPELDLGTLARGKSYVVSGSINLGAYFGRLSFEDTVAIP